MAETRTLMRPRRWRAGPLAGLLLSVLFGALLVVVVTFDLFLFKEVPSDSALPFTIRIPTVAVYTDTITGGARYELTNVREVRGQPLTPNRARMVQAYEDLRRPPKPGFLLGISAAVLLIFLLFLQFLRSQGGTAGLLRTQLTVFLALALLAICGKALLLLTGWSGFWIPMIAIVLPISLHLGVREGTAVGIAGSALLAVLNPLDLPLFLVVVVQVVTASALVRRDRPLHSMAMAAVVSAVAGLLAFVSVRMLSAQYLSVGALGQGDLSLSAMLASDLLASFASPIFGAIMGLALSPLFVRGFGMVSESRLTKLAHFEHPLLRRLATRAPGTWAHSLNMANFAEMAANAISADGPLVRVGAYYHDLGKSLEPEYFIENQTGENPHDKLEPDVSADAIFAHVAGGVELARKHGIPEAVVEFIYTHHANDRLEYFWHKSKKTNKNVSEDDFRYPGLRPNSRETGILAICDAVEAASRTLESPDIEDLRKLVRQIVFTKIENGILDQSGLNMEDLRKISESLVETLRSSMHGRVKYPWQEEEEAQKRHQTNAEQDIDEEAETVAIDRRREDEPIAKRTKQRRTQVGKRRRPQRTGDRASLIEESPVAKVVVAKDAEPAWVDSPEVKSNRERVATRPLGIDSDDD